MSELDLDTMARTLWAEARGEGEHGMKAVACVILNRLKKPGWWSRHRDDIPDDTIAAVCRDPQQFSCWNPDDPNREKLLKVGPSDRHFKLALEIATDAIAGRLKDITHGSDHYHTLAVAPKWSRGKTPVIIIGNHAFYNDIS